MIITESEFRSYPIIEKRLREKGWDTKSPARGGDVYTQNEATLQNKKLKEALGSLRPEYVVSVRNNNFWVIEAKAHEKDIDVALKQAKERARLIKATNGIDCRLITGVAGSPDSTLHIETHCLVGNRWKPLQINNRQSTGFISPEQAKQVLDSEKGKLDDYDIPDALFRFKAREINEILHNGAFHKRNRAGALACLLLALANDQQMSVDTEATVLIDDINTRARRELLKYKKEHFYKEIEINPPTTTDNHVKNREALSKSIVLLRDLNIASTIDSGRDILGQCYEEFLTYANDAKEVGIVLTPRHITNLGAKLIDIQKNDIVFDPTCGTGGFLVAALDKVKKDCGNVDNFKKGNLHGVEQDALIATLAIVNMVFRGDGSSNILEGDCLNKPINRKIDKVLMNPPFALKNEKEWQFVDKALEQMHEGGLLFAVLPVGTLTSSKDGRGEITWRKNMLKRHTLISVIKMPTDLFYPVITHSTCVAIIRSHRPHQFDSDKVVWAILKDGKILKTKTQKISYDNTDKIEKAVGNYIATQTSPKYFAEEIDCSLIEPSEILELSPEKYIGKDKSRGFDVAGVLESIKTGEQFLQEQEQPDFEEEKPYTSLYCKDYDVKGFFSSLNKGQSGLVKKLDEGDLPLITASKIQNGISAMVNKKQCKKTYSSGQITISDFGDAHYHKYEFAATTHVIVGKLKPEYQDDKFAVFLCAAINSEKQQYSFNRPLTTKRIKHMTIKLPTKKTKDDEQIDIDLIKEIVHKEVHDE